MTHTPTQEHGPRGEIARRTRLCHRFWCVSTTNTSFCMSKWCTCRRTTNHLLAPVPARYRACCVHTDIAPVPSKGSIGQLDPGLVLACTELGAFDLSRMVPVLWRILAPVVCVWQCSEWFGEWLKTARVRWIELALPQPPPPLSGLCGGGFSCVDSISAVRHGIVGHYVSVF